MTGIVWEILRKAGFNPNQTRDATGRWSASGGGEKKSKPKHIKGKHTECTVSIGPVRPTNPKQAAYLRWKEMTPEQKIRRAERVYNQAWKEVEELFGLHGSIPPSVEWVYGPLEPTEGSGQAAAYVTGDENGKRKVVISRSMIQNLTIPKSPRNRVAAKEILLHEWAHVYQNKDLLYNSNRRLREEAAELFASYWGHNIFGSPSEPKHRGKPPYENRRESSVELAAAYGKGYWEYSQFTENYGKDASEITW